MTANLKDILKKASEGKDSDVKDLFLSLLNSTIFIPTTEKTNPTPTIGLSKTEADTNYLYIDYEEARCIPIFSDQACLEEWAEKEIPFTEEEFTSFIWKLPHSVWAYLNPAQDIGKEISPWEIELLKLGPDSIEELVHGVKETEQEDFEITEASETLNQAKTPLLNILEAYPSIEECFLLTLKEAESKSDRALVGLKYNTELTPEAKDLVREEISSALKDLLPRPLSDAFIVDDLLDPNSMNHALFLDYSSFYKKAE